MNTNWFQILNGFVVVVGVPTIIGFFISVGKKLNSLETIENDLKDNIRPDLKDIRERFFGLEGRLSDTFANASPISLRPRGEEVLSQSGLKEYIDGHKEDLITTCCSKDKFTNQYDIQESAFKFFDQLDFGDFELKLKEASFQSGMGLETLRRIGGIYFRDILLEKYNFKPEDLDKPKTVI